MADNRREKERRYYFSRGQMALLGLAFTLTAMVVFVLGMFVGKEIEARKLTRPEESLIKVPIKPASSSGAAGADNAKLRDDLTFYNTLTKTPPDKRADEPSEEKSRRVTAKTAADTKAETKEARESSAKNDGRIWSVQVNSFPDEKSAHDLIDRLKNKGYNAFVTEANVNGKSWYRVRVGRFTSREEAEKTEAALNETYPKAFATRK